MSKERKQGFDLNLIYRPHKFAQVVGQDKIVKTLVRSLKKGKVHNAYLFAGKYGVGKTTLARLLAKGLNCENFKNDLCEKCVNNYENLDIVEIDAASNSGIEQARRIKEDSHSKPWGKYKVYIIDEAHQLTSSAGNALLKTLEEPTASTKFIFCTTQSHKLLKTLKSRCLPFYLSPIWESDIRKRLKQILDAEKIEVEDERILDKIAGQSSNTLRDAVNYLEICLDNLEGNKLTLKDIITSLSLISEKEIYKLIEYLVEKQTKKFFESLNELITLGKTYEDIIRVLKAQIKEVIFVKKGLTKGVSEYKLSKIKQMMFPLSELVKILKMLNQIDGVINNYFIPKDTVELGFFQILMSK